MHGRHMRRGTSIRVRLVTLLIGAVLPIASVGVVAIWSLWQAKHESADAVLAQRAMLAAAAFDRWLAAERQPLLTAAGHLRDRPGDRAALEEALTIASAPRPHSADVSVLDRTGAAVAEHRPETEPRIARAVGERLVAAAAREGFTAETDWNGANGRLLMVMAVPAGDGAVVSRVDGKALDDAFKGISVADGATVTLVEPGGRIVFQSGGATASPGTGFVDDAVRASLDGGASPAVVRSAADGDERVSGVAKAGAGGLFVTVGLPDEVLYASARHQLAWYAVVGLSVLLATYGAAAMVARSIVEPLATLDAIAARFGEGDFSARAPVTRMRAIAALAETFNEMAVSLEARQARLAEIDRIKSDFVSSVSHELRTPLTTIKALTRLLGREGIAVEKRREYLGTIAAECDRQIDLVLNLLDLSRIEGGVFRTLLGRVDVTEIVAGAAKAAGRGVEMRGHELVVTLDDDIPPGCADAKALGRVLGNVVENAIKYTPDGGRIEIAARADARWVTIAVTDNGRGVPPEDVPRLFDKFHRGRAFAAVAPQSGNPDEIDVSGVGLGLYLARSVMEQMGGRIGVETELGRGSTFTLYVPVWTAGRCEDGIGEGRDE